MPESFADPHEKIAFGLQAMTVALKARAGVCRQLDQIDFALTALAAPDEARAAALDFLLTLRRDPGAAADGLDRYVASIAEMPLSGSLAEHLARLECELALEPGAIPAWAARKDCGHG